MKYIKRRIYNPIKTVTMNQYKVMIINNQRQIIFNQVYDSELPETDTKSIIDYLLETPEFLDDITKLGINILDPTLEWKIYLVSPLNHDKDQFILELGKSLIDNNLDIELIAANIYKHLEDIHLEDILRSTSDPKLGVELKSYLINYIYENL